MEQEEKCKPTNRNVDNVEISTDDSMTSSHYCFGIKMKLHDTHEVKSKSLNRNSIGSSTSISMPISWSKRVGSRKKLDTSSEFDGKTEYGVKQRSLTEVPVNNKYRKETDTHKERFLRFFKVGFMNKSRKQKTDTNMEQTSPFEAMRNVSVKHSQFAKYLALENSGGNQSMTYLPSTVKMSLQWPEEDKSTIPDPIDSKNSPSYSRECVNIERIDYKQESCNHVVVIRPPKCGGHRSSSATQSDRLSELSTDRTSESCSNTENVYPPTPFASKSSVILRRPRTPTLGRAALFVRASYTSVDKSLIPSNTSFCKQNTRRDTILSNDSHLSDIANLSNVQSSFMSRSSSINCELREFGQNQQQSINQFLNKNDPLQSELQSDNSNGKQYETRIPTAISKRHYCHAYDTVPLDKLECLKLIPSVQMLNKCSDTKSEISKLSTGKSSNCVSYPIKLSQDDQKIQSSSTEYISQSNEINTTISDSFINSKHLDSVSIVSSSETEISLIENKQSVKQREVLQYESTCTSKVSSPLIDTRSTSKSCHIIMNSRKSVEIPKTSVQSVKQKSSKTMINAELPTSPKFYSSQKSKISTNLKLNKTEMKNSSHLTNQLTTLANNSTIYSEYNTRQVICRENTSEHIRESQNNQQCNQSIPIGSIKLRRRAKPELENEQHKDVSLRISIQEVKNLSAKGRYFCEICLDRTLYARTTSKLSDGTVFWGEQFDLNNLPQISIMTINLFRQGNSIKDKRQRSRSQNQFIAYVTVPLNDDSIQCEVQQWFTMQPPQLNPNLNYLESLQVSHQHHQLQQQNDINQSKAMNSVNGGSSGRFRKRSTPATCFGYSSSFSGITNSQYTNTRLNNDEIKCSNVEQSKKKSSWTAGVTTEINLNKANKTSPKLSCTSTNSPNLSPSNNSITANFILPENSFPQIRMKIQYQAVDVLPIVCYDALKEFIKTKYMDLIKSLEVKLSAKQKEELASCLVNIFEKLPNLSVAEFLAELLREDINNNGKGSMIFRANSTGSKAMECYIKLVGTDYLQYLLSSIIDQLLVIEDEFEIDPSRLGSLNDSLNTSNNRSSSQAILERNRTALLKHVGLIWQRIESSQCKLPKELRDVFITLAAVIEATHGVQSAAHLISSCLFLRFICPAIHGPVLFGLASSIPENNRISRNLTLIAKVLQNLANLTLFEDKEPHMKALNSFVEQEIPTMYKFLRSIASDTDSSYQSSTTSDCHEFIELGYEFAKLTQLLNMYISKINITPQIAELPSLLQNLTEALNSQVFLSWNHKSPVTCEKPTNNLQNNSILSKSGIPRHYSFTVQNSISTVDNRRQSETNTVSTKTPMTSVHEIDRKVSSEKPSTLKKLHHQSDTYSVNNYTSNTSIMDSNNETEQTLSSKQNDSWNSSIVQKDYLPCKFDSVNIIYKNVNMNDLEHSENIEDLLIQYREQLRQLNDCIEKVEPNCYLTSNISHSLSQSTQSVHKIKYLSESETPLSNTTTLTTTTITTNKQVDDEEIERQLSKQNNDSNESNQHHHHHTKRKIFDSKSDNSTPIPISRTLSANHRLYERSDNPVNSKSILTSNNNIREVSIHSRCINIDQSSTSDSDYDDDDDDDQRITDCTTEDTSESGKKVISMKNRSRKISSTRQNHLSESPSLDQLAERLQELKKMLQLERQEIEEVVASKTEVIKQQEKSIEQLESELDQLRREHRPSKMKPPNGRHTSKSTSRTVSPASSFSSECYSSDVTQACHSYNYHHINNNNNNNTISNNDIHNNNNNNNNNNFLDSPISDYHSNQGLNNISRNDTVNIENYRTQSFREKLLWRGQINRCEPQVRCDSNLLYLSRASEGTGIPLGHLIEANRSIHLKHRVSETKVMPQ
ncbi:unnamed protein product [Heterobilharzia americana]|nr:unnamed protein product [Heterobilharzia americana]